MEYIAERITIDPDLCNGKPTIRGKRIAVQTILEFLGAGESAEEILYQYPSLEPDDITACVRFAAELMNRHYTIRPLQAA
ncbi:DUF433 domain-containing protein [Larkinella punicea]|jgi:uncharacterized protein (DUF433 family)|uniref:DUF433 domain-containing protein n=1 Tax=Larkinella punicea TaxID=2315727 RepID=A0A368JQR5_9BACT|nr:DUF433 domain-containing protein [Larkinella punicea]RCR69014.1 DUF433 domain-containing protein [Larkinella punicea]